MHETQKARTQEQQAIRKGNGMLAFSSKVLEYKSREVLLQLYKVLVRPHQEYCEQFWSPYLRKDAISLEAVQRRFTRMIPGMEALFYKVRLKRLELYSLELRRMRDDLIQTYRILMGL